MRKWITRIAICGLIGCASGWFWHHEWVKPCKEVSGCPSDEIKRAELDFKSQWNKESRIREIKEDLRSVEKGTLVITGQRKLELKNELAKLTGTEKPVKIYPGHWTLEGYLEVIGK